jgi:hypothetical protein
MRYEKLIYGLGAIAVIAGAAMKIAHLPYANVTLLISFTATCLFQAWHVTQLKKRIKELESK